MRKCKLNIILICVSLNVFSQKTPEQIYEKYYAALGGKERLLGINTLTIISKDIVRIGFNDKEIDIIDTATTINYYKRPNKNRLEISTPKIRQLQLIIYNNSKGYFIDSLGNKTTQDSVKNYIYGNFIEHRIIPELYYKESGVKSSFAGIEKIGNRKAYKIICEVKGIKWYNFYNVRNNLKIRESQFWDGNLPKNTDFSNYKVVEGIKFPFPNYNKDEFKKFSPFFKNLQYTIKINEPIDDEKFRID
jgi:hypothetical protein